MNKAELIDVLTEKLSADRRTATDAVENIVDIIVRAVHKGQSVTITGFGVFEQRKRAARVARNPRTGETVKVKPTSVPAFRPGAQFKAVIAGKQKLPASGPAVKRGATAPTKTAAKKATKAAPARKTAATKAAPARKTAATKAAPAKTTARKTAATKAAPAKTTARKTAATKAAPAKTTAAKSTTARKTAATKAAPAKTTARKAAPAKKAPAKRATKKA